MQHKVLLYLSNLHIFLLHHEVLVENLNWHVWYVEPSNNLCRIAVMSSKYEVTSYCKKYTFPVSISEAFSLLLETSHCMRVGT